jgi:hypothetical protein
MCLKSLRTLHDIFLPLFHQLQPDLLCLLHGNREIIHALENLVLQLWAQLPQGLTRLCKILDHTLAPPISLLRGYIGGADDSDSGINKEQCKNLSVSRFGRIGEFEGLDAMLEDVGEGQESPFFAQDRANFLNSRTVLLAPEDFAEPLVTILRVTDIHSIVRTLLTESEAAIGNIFVVIVVEGGGTNMFVLSGLWLATRD